MRQVKTGHRIQLPLLKDVGWAVIDYIRHGRQDMADYIRYYNLDRGHTSNSGISPVRYEQLSFKKVSGFA
ncbi:hypothetical protein E2375_23990 [Salmonella enterica subsp. enterica serovar Muenchen]|nr:IS3 family transposase [Salmonella enterica subsp. enterica serovar Newport]EBP1503417.1 IS3 family transposase [Salmonella enterica]EBV8365464.1 hypothetical protein [Salmonella enterica subsp. enterica serovar Java]EBV8394364.1 hypothetical protein [Salmonella enterica subsp. enterica serovar Virchow]ECG6807770.1 hypothetical protein [Salmonella enterica subsp. enterica serovar Muenchen]